MNDKAVHERGTRNYDSGYWSRRGNGRDRANFGTLAEKGFRRATICISSQVGCAVNCQFCLTAKLGIRRNLTAGEIAGQVAAVLNRHRIQIGKDRINLVFMGMGEPFLNYDAFMASVRLLVEGVGIPESRMTVSTSGILPGMEAFARETVRPKLALSLNASNDVVREQIMPVTRKWKIAALLEAVQKIPLRTREWVTFEYVLLGGVNDQPRACARGAGAAGRDAREGEFDCVESGAGDRLPPADAGGCGRVPEDADRGRDCDVHTPAAGQGHLCGVRAVEADDIRRQGGGAVGGDCGSRRCAPSSRSFASLRMTTRKTKTLDRGFEAAGEHVFDLGPVLVDDAEPGGVALGAVRHAEVVAEGALRRCRRWI